MRKVAHGANPVDMKAAVQAIDADLPELARKLIRAHLDLSEPRNLAFLESPDGRDQHQVHWHQWGIITHTRVFFGALDEHIPPLLRTWHMWPLVRSRLDQPIDGQSRWDLLHVSVLLHDVGKFASRTYSHSGFHFARHERLSGEIVRREVDLARFGFTQAQSDYIATTAEDHFVLGIVRKRAREQGVYGPEFVRSTAFVELCEAIKAEHEDDFCEIGVLFLGDSLAKIDPHRGPEQALSQHAINVAVARRYLEITLGEPSI